MSRRTAAWLAWSMCSASLVLTVLGLFLLAISQSPVGAPVYAGAPVFDYWLVNTVVALSFSTVGAVIAPRFPPHNPIGWLFCTIGLVGGVRLFVAEYAIVTLLAEPGTPLGRLLGGEALAWVSSWLWVPHIGLFLFLALLFPDGRPPYDPLHRWPLSRYAHVAHRTRASTARTSQRLLFSGVTLLWSSDAALSGDAGLVSWTCRRGTGVSRDQHAVCLPDDVALEAADDLSLALALLCAPRATYSCVR